MAAPNLGPARETFFYQPIISGADALTTPGTDASTCGNWTGTGSTAASIHTWDTSLASGAVTGCASSWHLLCLEQ